MINIHTKIRSLNLSNTPCLYRHKWVLNYQDIFSLRSRLNVSAWSCANIALCSWAKLVSDTQWALLILILWNTLCWMIWNPDSGFDKYVTCEQVCFTLHICSFLFQGHCLVQWWFWVPASTYPNEIVMKASFSAEGSDTPLLPAPLSFLKGYPTAAAFR